MRMSPNRIAFWHSSDTCDCEEITSNEKIIHNAALVITNQCQQKVAADTVYIRCEVIWLTMHYMQGKQIALVRKYIERPTRATKIEVTCPNTHINDRLLLLFICIMSLTQTQPHTHITQNKHRAMVWRLCLYSIDAVAESLFSTL